MHTQVGADKKLSKPPEQERITTSIGADLDEATMNALISFLKDNVNVFAWKPDDMPGIDPNLFYQKLVVNPLVKHVCQIRQIIVARSCPSG